MSETQVLLHVFNIEVLPLLIELMLVCGFAGAGLFFSIAITLDALIEWSISRSIRKGRKPWLLAYAEKAKAKRAAQLRGGDAAGRACETGSGDAA